MEDESLGKPIAWQIRDVPEKVRDALVEQARTEGVKVPDLLTRLILDARDNGWTFAGSPRAVPVPAANGTAAGLAALVGAVADWSRVDRGGVSDKLATEVDRLLRSELRAYRGVPPRQPPRKEPLRLAGPEME